MRRAGPINPEPSRTLTAASGSHPAKRNAPVDSTAVFLGEKASSSHTTTSKPGHARAQPSLRSPGSLPKIQQTYGNSSSDRRGDKSLSHSENLSTSRRQDKPNSRTSDAGSNTTHDARAPSRANLHLGNDALGRDSTMQAIMAAEDVAALRHALNNSYYPLKVLHLAAAAALLSRLPLEDGIKSEETSSLSASPALKLMEMLVTEIGRRSRGCDFRIVSNVLGACAKIGYSPDDVTIISLLDVALTPAVVERHCRTAVAPAVMQTPGVDVDAAASNTSYASPATASSAGKTPSQPSLASVGLGSLLAVSPNGKSELQQCRRPQVPCAAKQHVGCDSQGGFCAMPHIGNVAIGAACKVQNVHLLFPPSLLSLCQNKADVVYIIWLDSQFSMYA